MSLIADNAPEPGEAPFTPEVVLAECPKTWDGRPKHMFAKAEDGVGPWICRQCGEVQA
jgi:hypothetical protein